MKRHVRSGDIVRLKLPHSEVCMHMRVAGREMDVLVLTGGAQLVEPETGTPYSAPILHGEAGIYSEDGPDGPRLYVVEG